MYVSWPASGSKANNSGKSLVNFWLSHDDTHHCNERCEIAGDLPPLAELEEGRGYLEAATESALVTL